MLKKAFALTLSLSFLLLALSNPASAAVSEPAYTAHRVEAMWEKGFSGQGMTVAIIDQGVNLTHPYFQNQIVDGICVYQPSSASLCPNGTKLQTGIQAASQRFDGGVIVNSENHGNMVSGLIAGVPNVEAPGGIAPKAKLLMANTDLQLPSIVTALNYIYENAKKYNIVAVSMSFGAGGISSREQILDCNTNTLNTDVKIALGRLRSIGVMPFAASGNGSILNEVTSQIPTCLKEAVSIGSVNQAGKVSVYTTMNSKVELLGTDYAKTADTNGYQKAGGTSAATPVVAAGYALLRQAFPSQSAEVVLEAMKSSGTKIDDVIRKQIPVVDLAAAYALLSGTPISESPVVPAPQLLAPMITVTTAKGKLLIYVRGFQGKKLSAKLGNTWISVPVLANTPGKNYTLIQRTFAAGTKLKYEIYIDGKKLSSGVRTIY